MSVSLYHHKYSRYCLNMNRYQSIIIKKKPFFHLQAGMQAVRENRYIILAKDFEKGYKSNVKKDEQEHEFYK